jgi:anthranilate/para-aminobenzoate synthase component I
VSNIVTRTVRCFTPSAPPTRLTRQLNQQSVDKLLQESPASPETLSQFHAVNATAFAKMTNTVTTGTIRNRNARMAQSQDNKARYYEALNKRQKTPSNQAWQAQQAHRELFMTPLNRYNPWRTLKNEWKETRLYRLAEALWSSSNR